MANGGWGGEEDQLWNAISEVVAQIGHQESEWDSQKLEKRIRDYFKKAAKSLEFGRKPWHQCVNDYCDAVFGSLFCGLGDRPWLAGADFLLAVDAGIKDAFPPNLLAGVSQQAFERAVLGAHDRAFEEQRFSPILWELVQEHVQGPKTRSKVRTSFEEGRQDAANSGSAEEGLDAFVARWIDRSIAKLGEATQGFPADTLHPESASLLFQQLISNGGLPLGLVQANEHLGPPDMANVDSCIQVAYAAYTSPDAEMAGGPPPQLNVFGAGKSGGKKGGGMKGKGKGKSKNFDTGVFPKGFGKGMDDFDEGLGHGYSPY